MTWIDLFVLLGAIGTALLGWSEGLLRALWGFAGLMLGTALAIAVVPRVFADVSLGFWVPIVCLLLVGVSALLVRWLAVRTERRLRKSLPLSLSETTDRFAGAVFGVGAALAVSWMLALAMAGSTLPWLADQAKNSFSLTALTRLDLPLSSWLADSFAELGRESKFDRYVDIIAKEKVTPVAAPDPASVLRPKVVQASASVHRIITTHEETLGSAGTGFVVAPQTLMTAAHVIESPKTITVDQAGRTLSATVRWCDPQLDVAILDVPGLRGKALRWTDTARGESVVVMGYPVAGSKDLAPGSLKLTPARVREALEWQAPDVHGKGRYVRQGYSLRGDVQQGDSGGPVVNEAGRVVALTLAISREHRATAYTLNRAVVAEALKVARHGDNDRMPRTGC